MVYAALPDKLRVEVGAATVKMPGYRVIQRFAHDPP